MAMSHASKSKVGTLIVRLTKQLETECTGRVSAEAQLDNERKQIRELENGSIKKQPVAGSIKTAEARQQAEQLLLVTAAITGRRRHWR